MKKVLSIILAVIMVVCALPLSLTASAEVTSGTTGDCTWTLNGTVLTINGKGYMESYDSPWGTLISEVVIEDGVEYIGGCAFKNCTQLKKVTIPYSVTHIGNSAFEGCTELTSITIPDSVTDIGMYAFLGSGLNSVTIPDSITSVGYQEFALCSKLISISIPSSVEYIDNEAFRACKNIESIVVDSNNTVYLGKGNCLINKATKELVLGCKNSVIPSDGSVTIIGSFAFESCKGLTNISIPKSVVTIQDSAFYGCESLVDVYYEGSDTDWSKIYIDDYNDELLNATIHYNYKPTTIEIKYGLVTENEEISASDALSILHAVVGKITFSENQKLAADVNGDGEVNATDALLILHFVVGKIDKFPVEG